jgi:nickel/cobalt transporter (NicO) family protein
MFHLIISSLVLSIIHATIPNHWLPVVAIGKVERWNKSTTLWATAISGTAHVASTILIGIIVGWAGYRLSSSYHYISSVAAPAILVTLGLFYCIRNFFKHKPHTHYGENPAPDTPFATVVISLSIGMFFSPCVELESYYFTAGTFGWPGIITVSAVYLVITVAAMISYVALAIEGINRFNFQFLEKNEKAIIGVVLILVGLTSYFVNF